jgi:hypothetical protein
MAEVRVKPRVSANRITAGRRAGVFIAIIVEVMRETPYAEDARDAWAL